MSPDNQHSLISELISQERTHHGERRTALSTQLSQMKSISLFILLLFALIALLNSVWLLSGILLFMVIFIVVAWHLTVKGVMEVNFMLTLASALTLFVYSYLLQTGGINGTGILWAIALPAIFAILKGANSLFWNTLFLVINASLFALLYIFDYGLPYSADDLIHLTGAYVFVSAITYLLEFQRLSQRLNTNLEEFNVHALINNGSDILCIIDPLSRMLYVSPAHKAITGFDDEEIIGKMGLDLLHPDDRVATAKVLSKLVTTKETQQARYRYSSKSGDWLWFEAKGTIIRNEQDEWLVLLNVRDVTQQVELEDAHSKVARWKQ